MSNEISNDVVLEKPAAEQTVESPKFDGLANRDALQKAMEIHRGEEKQEAPVEPTKKEVQRAVEEEVEPPAEFSAAGKAAWKSKDILGIQKEYRRIHDARTQEITRAQKAERDALASAKPIKELAEKVKNYLTVRGEENVPDEVKIAQALQLVEELRKRDGDSVKAELRKLGIDLDKAPSKPTAEVPKELQEEIASLREFKREYINDKQVQSFQKTVETFDTIFQKLTSEKTRAGEPVFPDLLDNSEKGMEFARELGSLTQDPTYRRLVLRRFPDADLSVLVREAYKDLGGRVSGDPVKVSTQSNQQHLQRSRRASAATPGRTAPRVNDSNLQGKLSNRAALQKALELHREH